MTESSVFHSSFINPTQEKYKTLFRTLLFGLKTTNFDQGRCNSEHICVIERWTDEQICDVIIMSYDRAGQLS